MAPGALHHCQGFGQELATVFVPILLIVSDSDWTDIAYVELITIFTVVATFVKSSPQGGRVLVYFNFAPSVYVFHSGRAKGNLHAIVWATYRLLG